MLSALSVLLPACAAAAAVPAAPGLVTVTDSSTESLLVSWRAADSPAGRLTGYALEYRRLGAAAWTPVADAGLEAETDVFAVQTVQTRADPGEYISDGSFKLALSHKGLNALDPESFTETDWLPFDVSAAAMQAALDGLHSVGAGGTEVIRSDRWEGAPDAQGGYRWQVTFEDPTVPLLVLAAETLSAPWSGAGLQVNVEEVVGGSEGLRYCSAGAQCQHNVTDLEPGAPYEFRVRAANAHGWSPYAGSRQLAATDGDPVPPRPAAPVVTARGQTTVSLLFADVRDADAELEVQLQDHDEWTWAAVECPQRLAACTVSGLQADTEYRFRGRVLPDGPFSQPTTASTSSALPGTPDAPLATAASATSVSLQWAAVAGAEAYEVRYRRPTEHGWTARADSVPAAEPGGAWTDVQTVTVRADEAVESGQFRVGWGADFTEWLPHDASAAAVEAAVAALRPATAVHVRRHRPADPSASAADAHGCFAWRVAFAAETPRMVAQGVMSSAYSAGASVVVEREREASAAAALAAPAATVDGLEPYTRYVFSVRAANGPGPWSPASAEARTDADLPAWPAAAVEAQTGGVLTYAAAGAAAANADEPRYVAGVGGGGASAGAPGEPGLVSVTAYPERGDSAPRTVFYFTGGPQFYTVPEGVAFLDVVAWGAGGGAGRDDEALGGAGAFAQAPLAAAAGEVLEVRVGGGGMGYASGASGLGGFNGGGDGGAGEFGGGGGGGASDVRRGTERLLVAGGGGGAGASDYCCAHGGAAGAADGAAEAGADPTETPVEDFVPRDEYNDERDLSGLPAEHSHLDLGFAPGADFSWLATGGAGASAAAGPGAAGRSGSYAFGEADAVPANASAGTLLGGGGSGADGKEAGGGGGGGYYGGGGGGAGVDGGGGGGGNSFVDLYAVSSWSPSDTDAAAVGAPGTPAVVAVDHESFTVAWAAPANVMGREVTAYWVDVAQGAGSEDFARAAYLDAGALEFSAAGLDAAATYRVRVRAVSARDVSVFSAAVEVTTDALPANEWTQRFPRRWRGAMDGRGAAAPVLGRPHLEPETDMWGAHAHEDPEREFDAPTEDTFTAPAARRGHSLTAVAGREAFLFGGRSVGYSCDLGNRDLDAECVRFGGHNVTAELWSLDLVALEWRQLSLEGPAAREKHAAAALGDDQDQGQLFVFGGEGADGQLLDDLWRLDPGHGAREDVNVTVEVELELGDVEAHFVTIAIPDDVPADMCMRDVDVVVGLDHPCVQQVELALFAPGVNEFDANFWTSGRLQPVQLASALQWGLRACSAGAQEVWFDDEAAASVTDCCPETADNLRVRPEGALAVLDGQPAPPGAEWRLFVYDGTPDGLSGSLTRLALNLTLEPCAPQPAWAQTLAYNASDPLDSEPARPPPRAEAAAVAVPADGALFIFGGRGYDNLHLVDTWRYDVATDRWVELHSAATRPPPPSELGAARLLTPWGLLAFGPDAGVWVRDVVSLEWAPVEVSAAWADSDPHLFRDVRSPATVELAHAPRARAWAAVALAGMPGTPSSVLGGGPRVLLFGGHDGEMFLDDVWELTLSSLSGSSASSGGFEDFDDARRDEYCLWATTGTGGDDWWAASCGSEEGGGGVCREEAVWRRAWCEGWI